MFFTIKESFETALKRRQKERLEAASIRRKLEEREREKKEKATEAMSKKESDRDSDRRGEFRKAAPCQLGGAGQAACREDLGEEADPLPV